MAASLTEEHLEELRKAFDQLDADQNGFLDEAELRKFCRICLEKRYQTVSDQLTEELVKVSHFYALKFNDIQWISLSRILFNWTMSAT